MGVKFNFIISGYNDDQDAFKLFRYNNGTIETLNELVLNNPSYVTSFENIVFTYTKNPLEMLAIKVKGEKIDIVSRIPLGLKSMTHLTFSKENNCLYGASYLDGCLCKIKYENESFSDLKIINHKELYGSDSKCHAVIMNEDETIVCCVNIATSTLYFYDTDLNFIKEIKLREGCGPRHAIWMCNMIYCITEYSNELIAIDYEKGALQYQTTLMDVDEESYGATLFIKNGIIYASNRGEETIACFKIRADGLCEYIDSFSVNGKHPRHMIEYKDIIISCNKNSNNVSFIDRYTKKEIVSKDFPNPSGVCIVMEK